MGIYLNPDSELFERAINSEVYVDKTPMIRYINSVVNTEQQFLAVSRPRRFGKSITANMLATYYGRGVVSRDIFSKRLLAKTEPITLGDGSRIEWDGYLGKFDVIKITMASFLKDGTDFNEAFLKMQKLVIRDIVKEYPEADYFDKDDLITTMEDAYQYTKRKFVIIIDEWDSVFREMKDDVESQRTYLDFLRNWLKDRAYVALAYMTGILPIKKYGKHSALNMFTEYSMLSQRQLTEYTGFTTDEVRSLANLYDMDFNKMRQWYDGYVLSEGLIPDGDKIQVGKRTEIYNPLSVASSVINKSIENYWNKTETYEALAGYIRMNYAGLKEAVTILMQGGRIQVDVSKYQNDMTSFGERDDILTMLIHLGYLGYDPANKEVFIPNREIMDEFKASTESKEWTSAFMVLKNSEELLKATWNNDSEKVASLIEKAHNEANNHTYNSEAALSYAIRLAYYAARTYYTEIPEFDSGKGYADIVYIPAPGHADKPAIIVELKYNESAETAISQIKRQNYPDRLIHYKGNLILVGINYDREIKNDSEQFKHHSCIIERA